MTVKQEAKKEFSKELFGYNKDEVDDFVNDLILKVEVLTSDVTFLKKELREYDNLDEKLLEPVIN